MTIEADAYFSLTKEQQDAYDDTQDELYDFLLTCQSRPPLPHEREAGLLGRVLTVKGDAKFEAKRKELQARLGFDEPELTGYIDDCW